MKLSEIAAIIEAESPYQLKSIRRGHGSILVEIATGDTRQDIVAIAYSEDDLGYAVCPEFIIQIRARDAVQKMRKHLRADIGHPTGKQLEWARGEVDRLGLS